MIMMKQNEIPYELIRNHYEWLTPQILERYERNKAGWISPYCHGLSWEYLFSPIELITWDTIRLFGLCPLYPQYPVNKFFLDFAHPGAKVVLECDGKAYHLDKEKDF